MKFLEVFEYIQTDYFWKEQLTFVPQPFFEFVMRFQWL